VDRGGDAKEIGVFSDDEAGIRIALSALILAQSAITRGSKARFGRAKRSCVVFTAREA